MLALIFAVLGWFISPIGLFTIGLGLVSFLALPVVSKATSWKAPSQLMFWLGKQPVSRVAFVLGEHGDLFFKRMSFNARGVEQITLDGVEKDFEDPDNALHFWQGLRFGLADETHGVFFDPRHAALGQRKQNAIQKEEYSYNATDTEWEQRGVTKWIKGVYEMPKQYEFPRLSDVRHLIDGGERSEYPHRTEEIYKHSRDPFNDSTAITKFFYPIIAFVITFGGIWFMADQFGTPGGSGTTVSYPDMVQYGMLAIVPAISERRNQILGTILALALAAGYLFVLYTLAGLVGVIGGSIGFLIGFGFLPVMAFASTILGPLAGVFSSLFFRLGFMGYRRPIFVWTPEKYELREHDTLEDTVNDPVWYGAFKSLLGFTFEPSEDSWGSELLEHDDLEARQVATDGGEKPSTNVPKRFTRTDIARDSMGAFIPNRIRKSKYYLHSGIAQARLKNSANGEKSLKRLLEAKEKHGEGDSGLDDRLVLYLVAIFGFVGAAAGVFFFIL